MIGSPGGEIRVPFVVEGFNAVSGFQFTIQWDDTVMELVQEIPTGQTQLMPKISNVAGIDFGTISVPILTPNNFTVINSQTITALWDEPVIPDIGRNLTTGPFFRIASQTNWCTRRSGRSFFGE